MNRSTTFSSWLSASVDGRPADPNYTTKSAKKLSRIYGISHFFVSPQSPFRLSAERIDLNAIFLSHEIRLKRRRNRSKEAQSARTSQPSSPQPASLSAQAKLSPFKLWCFR